VHAIIVRLKRNTTNMAAKKESRKENPPEWGPKQPGRRFSTSTEDVLFIRHMAAVLNKIQKQLHAHTHRQRLRLVYKIPWHKWKVLVCENYWFISAPGIGQLSEGLTFWGDPTVTLTLKRLWNSALLEACQALILWKFAVENDAHSPTNVDFKM